MPDTTDNQPILARLNPISLGDAATAPDEIMAFPAGTHTINATQHGKAVTRQVLVDAATAAAMQTALTAHEAGPQKPYFDFNHDDDVASAWPKAFRWENGSAGKPAGVYAKVEWSGSGKSAVLGKDYRSFSPVFFTDKNTPARVTGAPINMGGLVNDPAFRAQAPIWARHSPAASPTDNEQQPTHTTMTAEEKKAADAAALQAAEANKAEAETTAIKAKNKELENENAALKAKDAERRKADAKAKVDAAVARGAIPPKDEAIQAKWRGLIEADPAHADLLDALPGNDITKTITDASGHVIQAKDGAVETLRAFAAEKDHKKRGAIYAKDVSPIFKPGFLLGPVLAANSLGSISSELIIQRSLSLLKLEYPFINAITTDFSDESAAFNQTIKTRLRGALKANEYNPATGYGGNDATTTDVPITINRHIGVPVTFNVNELASTARDLFGEQAESMHSAVADEFVGELYKLITAAKFPNAVVAALAGFDSTAMDAVAQALFAKKVRAAGRFALLNGQYFGKLRKDTPIVSFAAFQKAEVITEYMLPKISGFQPYQAVSLPTAGNLTGFAGTPEALALAVRVPNDYTKVLPGASNGNVSIVTNADTGISVMLVQYVDHNLGTATARVAAMFGAAVGNKDTGCRLVSA